MLNITSLRGQVFSRNTSYRFEEVNLQRLKDLNVWRLQCPSEVPHQLRLKKLLRHKCSDNSRSEVVNNTPSPSGFIRTLKIKRHIKNELTLVVKSFNYFF